MHRYIIGWDQSRLVLIVALAVAVTIHVANEVVRELASDHLTEVMHGACGFNSLPI